MSSKILKNCKKSILHLLKTADFSILPFTFDDLQDRGVEAVNIFYHKDYPYSYEHPVSKATVKFSNGVVIYVYQYMENIDCYRLEIEVLQDEKICKINTIDLDANRMHSYVRAIKQAYSYRDFWEEVEF